MRRRCTRQPARSCLSALAEPEPEGSARFEARGDQAARGAGVRGCEPAARVAATTASRADARRVLQLADAEELGDVGARLDLVEARLDAARGLQHGDQNEPLIHAPSFAPRFFIKSAWFPARSEAVIHGELDRMCRFP